MGWWKRWLLDDNTQKLKNNLAVVIMETSHIVPLAHHTNDMHLHRRFRRNKVVHGA
jgi:hypothetical protein